MLYSSKTRQHVWEIDYGLKGSLSSNITKCHIFRPWLHQGSQLTRCLPTIERHLNTRISAEIILLKRQLECQLVWRSHYHSSVKMVHLETSTSWSLRGRIFLMYQNPTNWGFASSTLHTCERGIFVVVAKVRNCVQVPVKIIWSQRYISCTSAKYAEFLAIAVLWTFVDFNGRDLCTVTHVQHLCLIH